MFVRVLSFVSLTLRHVLFFFEKKGDVKKFLTKCLDFCKTILFFVPC